MEFQNLVNEYASVGFGELHYREVLRMVRAVVLGRRYPPSYSPTGRWDEDAFTALAHDWISQKLLRYHQLEHLLLSNQTLGGFRKGLELSFVQYLIGQKKRTTLDNLFRRASAILEADARFYCFSESQKKANRLWGLATWEQPEAYQGPEEELIAFGLRLPGIRVIRYRANAKKLSPVISDHELGNFLEALLDSVGGLINLSQFATVFRFRFNLLEVTEVSLDEPVFTDEDGHALRRGDMLAAETVTEEVLLEEEVARSLLTALSVRQQQVLLEYAHPDATLTSVAERLGCSKSTVDNELRRVMEALRGSTDTIEEAEAVYARLVEFLSSEEITVP
jgi:DNA-directed RNA polymerase specialized sigma24 family protein